MIRMSAPRRAAEIMRRLDPLYAGMTTGLTYSTPLELLVATILSAQCTDDRVNMVTPALFARYGSAQEYAAADPGELEALIHSCGFFRNKAKNIRLAGAALCDRFEGAVPDSMAALLTLPGVARKTANVVLSHAFARNDGIAVDTHVQRLARRLGLTKNSQPEKIEQDLMRLVSRDQWNRLSDVLIWHGRRVCSARSPHCADCVLNDICPSRALG